MCRRFGKNIFQIRYSLSLYENIEIRFKRPVSGYLTRQLSFLLNSYVYHSEGEDTDNPGILIPRYKALGRTAPNGEVYPTTFTGKPSEDDLVPVRSIVTKRKGDLNTITPDLIGIYKFKDLTDGSALGISLATSLTESITQEILGLKHGGHERVLDKTGYLKAPKACTFREEGKFIYLKVRGKELKYPRPSNLVTLGKDKFEEGENVCCAYVTSSPIMIPRSLIKVINAKAGKALRYYEKDDIITSDCYAFEDGTIHYVETKEGYIDVVIGNRHYVHEPRCMYYFPEGAEVKKFDRICSGVVNMNHVIAELGTNINDIYTIFRKQFYSLTDSDFISKGVTSPGSTQEEIIELVYTGLTKTDYNPNTSKIDQIQYLGVQNSILNGNSFYTMLSYGYGARIVNKAIKGDINLSDDIITNTVLGLLLNDKLDNK